MKTSQAFPSNYLKADDLNGQRPIVMIRSCKMEEIGGEDKLVLYFEAKDKGLVLNKTNANVISDILGSDETDDWTGQRIRLYPTKVDFQGKRVLAIRVEEAPVSASTMKQAKQQPPATEYQDDGRADTHALDEDVSF